MRNVLKITRKFLCAFLVLIIVFLPVGNTFAEDETLQSASEIWTFGYNTGAATGLGTTEGTTPSPKQVGTNQEWAFISAGDNYSLAIKTDGSLWSFGSDSGGKTGHGHEGSETLVPTQVGTDSDWLVAVAGNAHSLALKEDGTLWSFGWNNSGRTGLGITNDSTFVPTQVGTDTDWSAVAVGYSHSLALKENGTLWSFGANTDGQTGLGTTVGNTIVPTQVGTDTDWSAISAGTYLSLALKTDGSLWSFGSNSAGQTGLGTESGETTVPTQVGTDEDWSEISAGDFFSLVLKNDGSVWSFGANANGRTGLGTTDGSTLEPTQIGSSTGWETVSAGNRQALFVKTNGTLWSSGGNDFGQAGLGTNTDDVTSPTQVGTGADWRTVAAGGYHSVALREVGDLPSIVTSSSESASSESAILRGEVSGLGTRAITSWGFRYGPTDAYGETETFEETLGLGSFQHTITSLRCSTEYHFEAFVDTESGEVSGDDMTISTPQCPSGSGTTVQKRVENLRKSGNVAKAEELVQTWPHLFTSTSDVLADVVPVSAVTEQSIRDLGIYMEGEDVKSLQVLLNRNGFVLADDGPGSPGNETMMFGSLTQAALARYQAARGIVPAVGYFGALTRAHMKNAGVAGLWW